MAKIVALLDSMWGWRGYNEPGEQAPRYFRINPDNHSGRRLYRLCGSDHSLLVTNCCRYIQRSASDHGTADPWWVQENLTFLAAEGMTLLLVCGRIAKETFDFARPMHTRGHNWFHVPPDTKTIPVLFIDHPAARRWTNEKIESTAREIQRLCRTSVLR